MALINPIMGLAGWAWGQLELDEDWPEELKGIDFKTWFFEVFLPENLGDVKLGGVPVSDLVARGPINAITGEDIASRIGLADLWGRDSKETKTSRDSAIAFMLDHFGGPTASLLLGFADAYDAYAMGDYQKMMERMLPAVVRNLAVANKYADEGMKTGRGVELVNKDDVKTGELIGQAIGFRPDILAATQGPAFKFSGIEQSILNKRNLLLNKLDFQLRQDTDKGDEKYNDILENEVSKFNTKHPSYALDSDSIYNSLMKKAEQRASSRAGVIMNEKNIPIIEEAAQHVKADIYTGASTRNWVGYGSEVTLASNLALWQQNLLTDPQTSGGLLISCAPEQEAEVLSILNSGGFASAQKIGHFAAGTGLSVV
jgi:hypothetical protein